MRMHHIRRVLLAMAMMLAIGGPAARAGASVRAIPEVIDTPELTVDRATEYLDVARVLPVTFSAAPESELTAAREAARTRHRREHVHGRAKPDRASHRGLDEARRPACSRSACTIPGHSSVQTRSSPRWRSRGSHLRMSRSRRTGGSKSRSATSRERGTYRFDVRDLGSLELQMFQILVPAGPKAAYVEIKYIHRGRRSARSHHHR